MKQKIIENIGEPVVLEQLYRDDSQSFVKSFSEIADDYDSELVKIWKIRLSYEKKMEQNGFRWSEIWIVVVLALITGVMVKIPDIVGGIKDEFYYARDLALIVFNGIILYTFYVNKMIDKRKWLFYGLTVVLLALYSNLLPVLEKSDSINLALGHIALLLWCVFGLSFISFDYKNTEKRMTYIRFNGEYVIMNGLLFIAGSMLVALSFGLFNAIDIDMDGFYMNYIVVFGAAAIPVVSLYLIRLYPDITRKIAPVIARVFTPLVLASLLVYLVFLIFFANKISDDREALLFFNIMLLAVMAIIVFSVSELDKGKSKDFNVLVLFLLAALALVADAIALFAITSRLQLGFTPNRVVVFVSNVLIFLNLVFIAKSLFQSYFQGKPVEEVDKSVAGYLPVYVVYTLLVIFALPFIFRFY